MTTSKERTTMYSLKSKISIAFLSLTLVLGSSFASFAEVGPSVPDTATASVENSASGTAATQEELVSGTVIEETASAETNSASEGEPSIADRLKTTLTAQITDQIILVNDHNLTLWNRQSDGSFVKDMDVYCGYGRKGLKAFNERQEGDETTPIGSFPILHAFGFGQNPGTAMTWREITENSYWSGEKDTYNTWVESTTPVGGEHLSEYTICYKYAMAIGFNINPTVYKRGSAIFLHCKNPAEWGSAGCVSVVEEDMLTLLSKCHDGCYIMIVPNEYYIQNF